MKRTIHSIALAVSFFALGLCAEGIARTNQHDAGSPHPQGTGARCEAIASGFFDCAGKNDPDVFINATSGLGTLTFVGGAEDANPIICLCEADRGVPHGRWNCRCPLSGKRTAVMRHQITCQSTTTTHSFHMPADERSFSFDCH